MSYSSKSHILLLFSPLLNSFMSPLLQDIVFFSFWMPINDDVSKPIQLIEKTLKHFKWAQFMKSTVSFLIMYC